MENTINRSDKDDDNHPTQNHDALLVLQAKAAVADEKYLEAGRLLRQVHDPVTALQGQPQEWLRVADEFEAALSDLRQQPHKKTGSHANAQQQPDHEGWTKQSEQHKGDFGTAIYYKVDRKTNQLICLMEAAVPCSLVVPLMAIMNECALYHTWMPSFKVPFHVGYRKTDVLKEMGRGHLITHVVVDLPPPYHARDVILHARAVDEIDAPSSSQVVIRAKSLQSSTDDPCVPAPDKKVVRMDMDVTIVFSACPQDHPLRRLHQASSSKKKNATNARTPHSPSAEEKHSGGNGENDDDGQERILLFQAKQRVDAHVSFVPMSIINFFTRLFLQSFLNNFLSVGEKVRDGQRPEHQAAIQARPELYQWVQDRVNIMFEKLEREEKQARETQRGQPASVEHETTTTAEVVTNA